MSQTTYMGNGVKIGAIAHGTMLMTATPNPVPDEQAFEALKAGIDTLPEDAKMLVVSGAFYAIDHGTGNLELLSRFFEKYPSYADRVFLSVKGGNEPKSLNFNGSPENLRRSVEESIAALRGKKKIDLFECARVPPHDILGDVLSTLKGFIDEGYFEYIGMSECSAETLKKAAAIAPIASVEIEVSLWSYEEETKRVIATAKELGIVVHAYSPMGRGMLTGHFKSYDDLPKGDLRHRLSRYSPENFDHNLKLVKALEEFAARKEVTPAQLAIAWVRSLGEHIIPLPGSSKKERTLENLKAAEVVLTPEELKAIDDILARFTVQGGRYNDAVPAKALGLWG